MLSKHRFFLVFIIIFAAAAGGFFYFRYLTYYWRGDESRKTVLNIEKGQSVEEIAQSLKQKKLIKSVWSFYYYLERNDLSGKILPGEYEISPSLTIPEISTLLTSKKEEYVKITFPEGFSSEKMAERLSANGLPGEDFLNLSKDSDKFRDGYSFLGDSKIETLEGFLFPDTYFFRPDDTAEKIINRMLSNFSKKYEEEFFSKVASSERSLFEFIIMASIIEGEVRTKQDREMVGGLFWRRVSDGRPLQSCASIAYVLKENKKQYTFEDTRVESPYNTYINAGLPPGPINNPGLDSILAAIEPRSSDYLYFLSDPETGKTVFSKTIEDHNANKAKYGL